MRHTKFHTFGRARLDLYSLGDFTFELGIFALAHRHRFEHFDAALSLAAFLVSLPLAHDLELRPGLAPRRCKTRLRIDPADRHRHIDRSH